MKASDITKKLAELDELRAELLGVQARQSTDEKIKALADAQPKIARKTKEMEALLATGYDSMTVEEAKRIIAEREQKPELWPYEVYKKAQAFLAAYTTEPTVVSTRQPWHRSGR